MTRGSSEVKTSGYLYRCVGGRVRATRLWRQHVFKALQGYKLSKKGVRGVCHSFNPSNDWQMADCHSGLQPVQGLGLLIPELVLKLLKDLTHLMVLWLGARAGRDEVIQAQFVDAHWQR